TGAPRDPPGAPATASTRLRPLLLADRSRLRVRRRDRDLDLPRLRLRLLGEEQPQDAVLRLRRDVLHVDRVRQVEGARERAVGPLDAVVAVALVLALQL